LNLSAGINFNALPGHPKLWIIVKNILDLDYQPYGSYIPAMGRNFKVELGSDFSELSAKCHLSRGKSEL